MIKIPLPDGTVLAVDQSSDPSYPYEVYVGLMDKDGVWFQDLAIVRNSYHIEPDGRYNHEIVCNKGLMEVLVFGDEKAPDYTNRFEIGVCYDELFETWGH